MPKPWSSNDAIFVAILHRSKGTNQDLIDQVGKTFSCSLERGSCVHDKDNNDDNMVESLTYVDLLLAPFFSHNFFELCKMGIFERPPVNNS